MFHEDLSCKGCSLITKHKLKECPAYENVWHKCRKSNDFSFSCQNTKQHKIFVADITFTEEVKIPAGQEFGGVSTIVIVFKMEVFGSCSWDLLRDSRQLPKGWRRRTGSHHGGPTRSHDRKMPVEFLSLKPVYTVTVYFWELWMSTCLSWK